MQEKVQSNPPEAKIYENQIPPTSWYKENILQYYQVKSEIDVLTGLMIYMQQRDVENLRKSKQEGKQVLEFSYAPEGEGTADEVANASTYNLLQTHVGTQIQYLTKLINILKAGDPRLAKELDQALNQLSQMAKGFPGLSPEELASLSNLLARFSMLSKQMPPSTQKSFWETLNTMLEKMIITNTLMTQQFTDVIKSIQDKMREMGKFKDEISTLLTMLAGGQIKEGLSQFIALLKNYSTHSPELKKALSATMSKVGKMKGKNGVTFLELMASAQVAEWIKNCGPNATKQQIVEHIKQQLKEPPFNKMSPPLMADYLTTIHHTKVEDAEQTVANFTLDPASEKKGQDAVEGYFTEQQQQYESQAAGYGQAATQAGSMGDTLGRAAVAGATNGASSGSLPNQFQNAILNHYMPSQEAYLMQLAELLNFDNMGAEIGNALLSIMSNFAASATNFDINSTLHGTGTSGQYSGTPTYEGGLISKATSNAYQTLNNIKAALAKIASEAKSIENNPNLTQAQKNELLNKLQGPGGLKSQLEASEQQVGALYELYAHLKVSPVKNATPPPTYEPKVFTLSCSGLILPPGTTWEQALPAYENMATNGATSSDAKKWGLPQGGGLVQISSNVNTFQQTYADQGQNQQMTLQMRMTEIQQEWTVVSTALQLLNQMYMSLAQGVYK